MKKTKKFVSFIMAVVILFSGIATFPVTALDNESTVTTENDDLTVSGTNSTGNLIANALSDVQAEQEENNGYNVFSATVEDNAVLLEVETLEDCTVVVCIYDEAGTKFITSGYTPITTEDKTAIVVLETEEMPQYFYLRAFLVDSNTFRPICKAYDCPNYTQEMQDFLAKTTEDFEEDRVVNFDDSVDNNFAVYDESTIVIPEDSTGNDVASVDDETGVYVIENADESITSLVAGDIFAYEYEDGNILIVKVAEITIDGTTATIKGEETTLEEVFEYVKIDTTAGIENAEIDTSTLEEGVSYDGVVEVENDDSTTYAVDAEGKKSLALSFGLDKNVVGTENNNIKISGRLEYNLDISFKAYISFSYTYLEFKIKNSIGFDISVGGKISDSLPLLKFAITLCAGVKVEFKPEFLIEFTGKISLSGKLKDTLGFSWSSDEGTKNLTSKPKFETEVKVEGGFFLGIKLSPTLVIINKTIGKVELEGRFGGEVKAEKMLHEDESSSSYHVCDECIDGDITGVFDITFKLKLLGGFIESEYSIVDVSLKLSDFYYSYDYNEFEFTTCPHIYHKVSLIVTDNFGKSISDATVNIPLYLKSNNGLDMQNNHTSNSQGEVVGYLPNGEYIVEASKENYVSNDKKVTVKDEGKTVKIELAKEVILGATRQNTISLTNIIAKLLATTHGAIIKKNGDLYMWGSNHYGQLGDGTQTYTNTPKKIMSNVVSVSLGTNHSAAITSNGDLYLWGNNTSGQIGVGYASDSSSFDGILKPTKIMSNVIDVSLGSGFSAAVTADGSLYTWGIGGSRLGNGTSEDCYSPIKIMSNIVDVEVSAHSGAAITSNGDLLVWGNNEDGNLGIGAAETTKNIFGQDVSIEIYTPKKIMSNVLSVSLSGNHGAAIKNDRTLWMWGDNEEGQLGNGTTTDSYHPIKVMSNVASVSVGAKVVSQGSTIFGNSKKNTIGYTAAITTDGNLYMWGNNSFGQLGKGISGNNYKNPQKIMSDVDSVSLGAGGTAILKNNGSLYFCGEGEFEGSTEDVLEPIFKIGNVRLSSKMIRSSYSINYYSDATTEENTDTEIIEYTTIEDTTADTTAPTEKTAEFTGLLANEVYNFYVMKDRESELPFGADNLLYMTQAVSDADGKLSITYTPTAECDTADIFVKGMTLTDISTSHTISHDIMYNRAENLATIDVVCNGEYLEEGLDYEITGGQISKNIGTYTATITGIGDYTGTLTTTYEVYCGHDYNTGKCIMCGHNKGDADANGEINIDDYNLMASASALTTVIEDDVARCDMNGDGVVDGFDVIILDLRNNDMLRSTVTGDANGDGMVDDNDYTFLESVINGETATTDNVTRLCDLNSDGTITTDDLTMLESYLNGNLDWA